MNASRAARISFVRSPSPFRRASGRNGCPTTLSGTRPSWKPAITSSSSASHGTSSQPSVCTTSPASGSSVYVAPASRFAKRTRARDAGNASPANSSNMSRTASAADANSRSSARASSSVRAEKISSSIPRTFSRSSDRVRRSRTNSTTRRRSPSANVRTSSSVSGRWSAFSRSSCPSVRTSARRERPSADASHRCTSPWRMNALNTS